MARIATKKTVKASTTKKIGTRRSDEEILQAAIANVEAIKRRIEMKEYKKIHGTQVKLYRQNLIKIINKMKNVEELEKVYQNLGLTLPEMPVAKVENAEVILENEDAEVVMEAENAEVTTDASENETVMDASENIVDFQAPVSEDNFDF